MPDRRRHRGAHPRDPELFGADQLPALRNAAHDYAWLSTRGYAADAALALVGNRYQLTARQRTAISRVVCSDAALARRTRTRTLQEELAGQALRVDGFNVCITVEVAMSGGPVLVGREGAHRDLASVHGTYRRVHETPSSLEHLTAALEAMRPVEVTWYFDRPVSNSGTLAAMLRRLLQARGLHWSVELADDVDRRVSAAGGVALSADSGVIDVSERWFDVAGHVVRGRVPDAWIVDVWGQ